MVGMSMAYNAATTGDPLVSAYLDWDYGGATLGFKDGFTFDVGLRNEQALMMAFVLVLNNWPTWVGLTFVFLPFMLGTRNIWDYWCLLCSLLVISVYVLYQWSGIYEGPRLLVPGCSVRACCLRPVAPRLRAGCWVTPRPGCARA